MNMRWVESVCVRGRKSTLGMKHEYTPVGGNSGTLGLDVISCSEQVEAIREDVS